MSKTYDAIIIGGGIVGCACAYYLSFDLKNILLISASPIGGGTTAAGMGHIVAMDDSPAQLALTRYSQQLWQGLYPQMPKTCEVETCGTLWVAADEEEASFLPAKHKTYAEAGVPTEILDAKAVEEAEPALRKGLAGGLRVPEDSVIYPMAAARWLLDQAKSRGAEEAWEYVDEIEDRRVLTDDHAEFHAPLFINAAGPEAHIFTEGLPIKLRKGHLVITDRYPERVNHQLVELGYLKSAHSSNTESVAFNVQPRATGQLLIGSSRQFGQERPEVERRIVAKMLARAVEYMPSLADMQAIRTWTGFRSATPDKLPLIGQWDNRTYIAAGHEGLGITTSLATGKMLADQIAGREPAIDLEPFDPKREMPFD